MSLPISLRASSSRLPQSHQLLINPLRPQPRPRHRPSVRHASNSTTPATPLTSLTVQDADRNLASMRRQVELAKKSGQQIDVTSLAVPILEPITEPYFPWRWWLRTLFKKEGRRYLTARAIYSDQKPLGRLGVTIATLSELQRNEAFDPAPKPTFWKFLLKSRPGYIAQYFVDEAVEIYTAYNIAQASGDRRTLKRISLGQSLTSAQSVASSEQRMTWDLTQWNERPKIMWARLAPLDPAGESQIGQVCVRFDATQVLSILGPNGRVRSRKERRVVDHIVFERVLPGGVGWRLKEKVEPTVPSFLTEEVELAKKEATAGPGRPISAKR